MYYPSARRHNRVRLLCTKYVKERHPLLYLEFRKEAEKAVEVVKPGPKAAKAMAKGAGV